ncbi:hypothetical protein Tco_0502882 [Tanacetum coccineum]
MARVDVDTLSMEQYLALFRENQAPVVVKPKIKGNVNFEIKSQFMRELREDTFSGNKNEDAHDHIDRILSIVSLFNIPGVSKDAVMLRVFPFNLTGATKRWVDRLVPGTTNTWDLLKKAFIQRYCPPSKTAKQLEDIHNFTQKGDESLYQAWERYNGLLYKCPTHDINSHQKRFRPWLAILKNGTIERQVGILEAVVAVMDSLLCGEDCGMWPTCDSDSKFCFGYNEVFGVNEQGTLRQWICFRDHERRAVKGSYMGFADFLQVRYGQQKIDDTTLERRFLIVMMLRKNMQGRLVGCQICEGSHLDKDFPLNEEVKQVEEVRYGEFGRTTPFNGSNGGKFRVRPPGYYTKTDNRPPYSERRQSLKELLAKHQEESA